MAAVACALQSQFPWTMACGDADRSDGSLRDVWRKLGEEVRKSMMKVSELTGKKVTVPTEMFACRNVRATNVQSAHV